MRRFDVAKLDHGALTPLPRRRHQLIADGRRLGVRGHVGKFNATVVP